MTDYDFAGKDQVNRVEADMKGAFNALLVTMLEAIVDEWMSAFRKRIVAYRQALAIDYHDALDFELDEYEAYVYETSYLYEMKLDELGALRENRLRAFEELIMERTDVSKHAKRISYLHQKCCAAEMSRDIHFDMVRTLFDGYRQQIDDIRSVLNYGDIKDAIRLKEVLVMQMATERLPLP